MDINTFLIDMDVCVAEHIVKCEDGTYSVFINARLSHEKQLQAYRHALKHIKRGDFDKSNADCIEFEAHEIESA